MMAQTGLRLLLAHVSMILYEYTATAGQTTFSGSDDNSATLSYTADNLQVVMNGVVLDPDEFTATNGTSVVLDSGAALNDELVIWRSSHSRLLTQLLQVVRAAHSLVRLHSTVVLTLVTATRRSLVLANTLHDAATLKMLAPAIGKIQATNLELDGRQLSACRFALCSPSGR